MLTSFTVANPNVYLAKTIPIDNIYSSTLKEDAYQILVNKCNICHLKRNKRRVFTMDNMNAFAKDINKQVFIKKRMPKGQKIKLNVEEYQILLSWISNLNTL